MALLPAVQATWRRAIERGSFSRHVVTLTTGTTLSLALLFLASPILTRLYSPAEFAVFELFLAVSITLSHLGCGKFDHAIILPQDDHDAMGLWLLCIGIACALGALLFGMASVLPDTLARLAGEVAIAPWLTAVPAALILGSAAQASLAWCVRRQRFVAMSASRVTQALVLVCGQIGLGMMGVGVPGLIVSQLAGLAVLLLVSMRPALADRAALGPGRRSLGFRALARRYVRCPRYLMPAHLVGDLALALPLYLFSGTLDAVTVGCYALANRVLGFPVNRLTGAISDVFRQRAAADYAAHGNCRAVFVSTARALLLVSILPVAVAIVTVRGAFPVIFGAEWATAGIMAQILLVRYAVKFVTDPVSVMFVVAEKQNYELIWHISRLGLTAASIILGLRHGVWTALTLYVASMSLMYLVIFYCCYRLTIRPDASAGDEDASTA